MHHGAKDPLIRDANLLLSQFPRNLLKDFILTLGRKRTTRNYVRNREQGFYKSLWVMYMFILFPISKRTTSYFIGLLKTFMENTFFFLRKLTLRTNVATTLLIAILCKLYFINTQSQYRNIYQQKYISHFNWNSIYLLNLLGVLCKQFSLAKFDRGRETPYGEWAQMISQGYWRNH